jgi:hypothetical protein
MSRFYVDAKGDSEWKKTLIISFGLSRSSDQLRHLATPHLSAVVEPQDDRRGMESVVIFLQESNVRSWHFLQGVFLLLYKEALKTLFMHLMHSDFVPDEPA